MTNTLTLDVTNFLKTHSALISEIGGQGLVHILYSHVRRSRRRRSTRRQVRKAVNRKRRWFVDNIIMHHKRLHDRNREMTVRKARMRALERKEMLSKPNLVTRSQQKGKDQSDPMKWRNAVTLKERGEVIRGRIDARMLRARSRWLSLDNK